MRRRRRLSRRPFHQDEPRVLEVLDRLISRSVVIFAMMSSAWWTRFRPWNCRANESVDMISSVVAGRD